MNKIAKLSIVLGICLMCFSLVLSLFNINKIFKPLIENSSDYEYKEVLLDSITSLEVDTHNEKVNILVTNEATIQNKIIVKYYENNDHKYKTEESDINFKITKDRIYNFLNFTWNSFETYITIEVPVDYLLNYNIKTSNDDITLEDIKIGKSTFKTSNGKIIVEDVESIYLVYLKTSNETIKVNESNIKNLELKTSNGNINLANVIANEINGKTSNDNITLNNVTSTKVDMKTSNSKMEFNNLASQDINLETSNAHVEGSIRGNEEDYKRNIKTSNDNIFINNTEYGKKIEDNNGLYNLRIKTSNDNINISFK